MDQLIQTLFYALDDHRQSDAEAQAAKDAKPVLDMARQRLSDEEFDQLWNAIICVGTAECLHDFTRGFRLGVQLTLEGLRPVV